MEKDNKNNINQFIIDWNNKYPYDHWWRKKYNVPFGSKQHREMNFIDMSIEFKEDLYFKKLTEINKNLQEEKESEIVFADSKESAKKVQKMTKKDIDKEFDDIDLDKFNE